MSDPGTMADASGTGTLDTLEALSHSSAAIESALDAAERTLGGLASQLEATRRATRASLESWKREIAERADLAAAVGPRLLSDAIHLSGPPHRRLRITRRRVHSPLNTRLDTWIGVAAISDASEVTVTRWNALLDAESRASEGMLRCGPSVVLDVGPATVTRRDEHSVDVDLLDHAPPGALSFVALPRFTYDWAERKRRNFGHWLLDSLPQVASLRAVVPNAHVLLPTPLAGFQRRTLELVGVQPQHMHYWNGDRVACRRLVVLENDGRAGGGRPFSSILAMREAAGFAGSPPSPTVTGRRLYVSRRDAPPKRQWVTNEPAIEALFASRGFEILVMQDCPLSDQQRLFSEAAVVAGVSGAGLSDIVFSPPGTHVVVLHSDSLVRWYADESGARSSWTSGARAEGGELAALGDSPRFYAHLAAALSQPCHTFLGPDNMPIAALAAFLDQVLSRVEAHG